MESKNKTLNSVINEYIRVLEQNGIDDARNNVMTLVEFVLGCSRSKLTALSNDMFDNVFVPEQKSCLNDLVVRRIEKEPLQYIVGETEFMGLPFYVSPDVLIPRQDTEVLVEKTLEQIDEMVSAGATLSKDNEYEINILDMCTGSGCIAISLAAFLKKKYAGKINVTAVDISESALKIAERNVERNGVKEIVTLVKSDLFAQLDSRMRDQLDKKAVNRKFDVIVSNPPYIPSEDCKTLQDEVMREPALALDGGDSGFDFYEMLISEGPTHLNEAGCMLFEFGFGQDEELKQMASDVFNEVDIFTDYAKIPRVIRMESGK